MHSDPVVTTGRSGRYSLASVLSRPILVLLALQLMGGMLLSPHRTFFPLYLQGAGYSAFRLSTLSSVRLAMAMAASLIGGTLCDTLGRKWTLWLGNLGFVAGSLAFLDPSLGWVGVTWALSGLGMGLRTLGSQSYLIDVAPPDYLGVLAALYNWGYTLGGALGGPLAGLILARWGYGAFGSALALFAVSIVAVNGLFLPRARPRETQRSTVPGPLAGYGALARRRSVVLLSLLRFLPTVYWGMALILIPLMLHAAGASVATVALYAAVSQVVASLAQLAAGRAADRYGAQWPTLTVFAVLVLSALGTGLLADQLWGVFVTGVSGASAGWSLSTLLPSLVARATEAEERGRVLGWIHLWWNVAMILGSLLGGALYERGAGLPFLVAGVINVASVGVAVVFFGLQRGTQPAASS